MNKKIFVLLCTGAIFALSGSIHAAESGGKDFMALVGKPEKAKTYTNKTFIGKRFSGSNDKVTDKSSGAVIRVDPEDELVVTGCTFRDNGSSTWGTWGGAIAGSEKTVMTITNSTFFNNKAHHGGALSLVGKEQKLTLKDVSFNDNHGLETSGSVGGAIHLQGAGIKMVYQVSAGKSIVNSGNTAIFGGFLHTHNGGIDLVFDVDKKGELVIGKNGANTDSLNLARGTTFRKTGSGSMIINSSITQESPYGGQGKTDGSDFVVEKGILQLTHAGQIKGVMEVLSGGALIIPDGCTVENVIVRKGGRLLVEKGGKVSDIKKDDGAKVELLDAEDTASDESSAEGEKKDDLSKKKNGKSQKKNRN